MLDIVGATMEMDREFTENAGKWMNVGDKQKRPEDRALGCT